MHGFGKIRKKKVDDAPTAAVLPLLYRHYRYSKGSIQFCPKKKKKQEKKKNTNTIEDVLSHCLLYRQYEYSKGCVQF